MKLKDYLKEQSLLIFSYIIVIFLVWLILTAFAFNFSATLLTMLILLIFGFLFIFYGYFKRKTFYNDLFTILDNLDNKTLIMETVSEPSFIDGKLFMEAFKVIDKYMIDEINGYKFKEEDFKDFMEMWVHEIKTPLATINLIAENNKNEVTDSIKEEALKIEHFIEVILFYARSQRPEKDYLIKNINLEEIINKVILKHKKSFLYKNITLNMKNLNVFVKTDSKWLLFIIDQIITNSIKYLEDNPCINIYAIKYKEKTVLYIEDSGIGISESDLPRVFDKGFTGANGRSKYNSTGMGLYLVKKLCDKLGHGVEIKSVIDKGTTVMITFPIGSFTEEVG